MKRHLSVLMLASRTIWRVLAILLLTAAVQTALFAAVPKEIEERYEYPGQSGMEVSVSRYVPPLEETFERAHTGLVAGIGFVLLCFILCVKTSAFGSRARYTVARLRVREEALNLWWMLYHTACMALFWMSQICVVYLLCRIYVGRTDPSYITGQTVALACYRHTYLHNLIPGVDVGLWVRNAALLPMMGAAIARFAMVQRRRGGICFATLAAVALTVLQFCLPLNSDFAYAGILLILVLLGVLLAGLLTVYRADETEWQEVRT